MARDSEALRVLATNRKARHLYTLSNELECGITLTGTEVKSLRAGGGSLADAYGQVKGGELYLVGMHIPEYAQGTAFNHEPTRRRKLLAHRREIEKLLREVKLKGVTLVPLEVYFKGHLVKVKLAVARGKRQVDKRQSERARSAKREIERALQRRR